MRANEIITGDALAVLRTLPAESAHCIVTSPPYYNLRDYGVAGQIGLEETPTEYIAKLVEVFHEASRVLRKDGTCWVNLGDSYSSNAHWSGGGPSALCGNTKNVADETNRGVTPGYKPKNLMMIPARVAIALQDDGWILRSDVIWHKPTAMPESVTDRPTSAHEHIFLLAKSERYFYDAVAIREASVSDHSSGNGFKRDARLSYLGTDGTARGNDEEWKQTPYRNKRNVWTVASAGYPEAHFATMPPKLVEPCILAGTSPRTCEHCSAPWQRQTEQAFIPQQDVRDPLKLIKASNKGMDASNGWGETPRGATLVTTTGWQPTCSCAHNTGAGKCVVPDPFMGAGTVALVALRLQRQYLGIELNPSYIALAEKRIREVQPTLWVGGVA